MFVHIIFSSVLVAEWPPFGKKLLTWAYVLFEMWDLISVFLVFAILFQD